MDAARKAERCAHVIAADLAYRFGPGAQHRARQFPAPLCDVCEDPLGIADARSIPVIRNLREAELGPMPPLFPGRPISNRLLQKGVHWTA